MPFYERNGLQRDTGVITRFGSVNTAEAPSELAPNECLDALNLRQVNLGWWYGRTGSVGHTFSSGTDSSNFPYEARMIHEYQTVAGTPAVGSPGVTTAGDTFYVLFCNTDAAAGGGSEFGCIMVYNSSYDFAIQSPYTLDPNITTGFKTIHKYIDYNQTAQNIQAESKLIPNALTFHGKVIMPLPANGVMEIWVENNVFYVKQVALPDFDINTVLVDARQAANQENNGAINGSLALSQWTPQTTQAPAQSDGLNTSSGTAVGAYTQRIINRADSASDQTYNDVLKNPIRNALFPPIVTKEITVGYSARTSPITGFGWQSRADIFYTPQNQVPTWNQASSLQQGQQNFPDSRYGYRFVWQFGTLTDQYSNASADLWVGDMLWSVLTSSIATSLHSTFTTQSQYGEPPTGMVGSTAASSIAANATTVTVQSGAGASFPAAPGFLFINQGNVTDIAWYTNITGDVITIHRGVGGNAGSAFTVGGSNPAVNVWAFGDTSSVNSPSASFGSAAKASLVSLKSLLYDSTHLHYSDDVWMTTAMNNTAAASGQVFDNDSFLTTGLTQNYIYSPAIYGMQEVINSSNRLLKAAGFTFDVGASGANNGVVPIWLGTGSTQVIPNIVTVDPNSTNGMQNFKTSVGNLAPLLVMNGYMDWEFCANTDDQATARQITIKYYNTAGTYTTAQSTKYHSLRRLIPVQRLLWDWQLSQLFPSSVIFNAPRVGLTIKSANIPTGATNLLIFRTKNSLDPSFSPTDYGLVATVPVPASGDFYYFDQITDDNIDFGTGGSKPEDFEGVRFGINANYIETLGERVIYGNVTHRYFPNHPRQMEVNSSDSTTPNNTDCRVILVSCTATNNPTGAPTANAFASGNAAFYTYKCTYKDLNGIQGETTTITPIDKRVNNTDAFVIVGYFMGQGYNPSIQELDIYRADSNAGTTLFLTALKPSSDTNVGGFFEDDNAKVLGAAYVTPTVQTTYDPSALYYTEPLRPEFIPELNLQQLAEQDGDFITGLKLQTSDVIITKQASKFRMFIDTNINSPQIERIETITREYGCISPCSLIERNGLLYYLSAFGLKAFDGTRDHDIDVKVHTDLMGYTQSPLALLYTAYYMPRYDEYVLALNQGANPIAYAFNTANRKDFITSRFQLYNEKLFLTCRNGKVLSTFWHNTASGSNRNMCPVIVEDSAVGSDYVQTTVAANTSQYLTSSWLSGLTTGKDSVRIKRARRARIRAQHYTNTVSLAGTITATNGSPNILGAGTSFVGNVLPGDYFYVNDTVAGVVDQYTVLSVTDNTHLVLTQSFAGATQSGLTVKADHYAPFAYTLMTNNTGQVGSVSDTTRYHFGTAGEIWDDSLLFVFGDNERGLDLQSQIQAASYNLILKAYELDYHTRQASS